MFDWITIFADPQTWIELFTLIFLEIALGIDNLVFIVITADRLPENQQHKGRIWGLVGALVMRIALLACINWIMSFVNPIITLGFLPGESGEISVRDIILFVGGLYLIYKGIIEIVNMFKFEDERMEAGDTEGIKDKSINMFEAIVAIMFMNVVLSLDSVITAVGLVGKMPIMVIAIVVSVIFMMIFIDWVSKIINTHAEIKILAMVFIAMIGILLACEAFCIEIPKGLVYFAMFFALFLDIIEIVFRTKRDKLKARLAEMQASGELKPAKNAEGAEAAQGAADEKEPAAEAVKAEMEEVAKEA